MNVRSTGRNRRPFDENRCLSRLNRLEEIAGPNTWSHGVSDLLTPLLLGQAYPLPAEVMAKTCSTEREELCNYIDCVDSDPGERVPKAFMCPVSLRCMRIPVVAADGHTYERDSLAECFAQKPFMSPVTGVFMAAQTMIHNYALASIMEDWFSSYRDGILQGRRPVLSQEMSPGVSGASSKEPCSSCQTRGTQQNC